MLEEIELPLAYTERFEKHPQWMTFFENNNLPCFVHSSTVATFLNATTIYYLLEFEDLESMVHIMDEDISTRLYIVSLFAREKYDFPYAEVFTGDLRYQHYRAWRLFFSCFLKQYACDVALIHFIMTTIDHVFAWGLHEINIALTLLYEWMVKAKMYGYDIKRCQNGHDFSAFLTHVGQALFDTQDDTVIARELCKRFWLTFDGAHSFDILIHHFTIWEGARSFYTHTPHRLSVDFTKPFIQHTEAFI